MACHDGSEVYVADVVRAQDERVFGGDIKVAEDVGGACVVVARHEGEGRRRGRQCDDQRIGQEYLHAVLADRIKEGSGDDYGDRWEEMQSQGEERIENHRAVCDG